MDTVIPNRDPSSRTEQLCSALNRDKTLLILDNFEHVHEAGVEVLSSLRRRLPLTSILVTSRQSLNLEGETELAIDPLPIHLCPRRRCHKSRAARLVGWCPQHSNARG